MPGKNLLVQYRLDSNSAEMLMQEAKRRGMTENACASFLLKKALVDRSHLIENIIKVTTTNTYQLANSLVEIFKILRPELSDSEIVELLNQNVFIPAKSRTEAHLSNLGIEV